MRQSADLGDGQGRLSQVLLPAGLGEADVQAGVALIRQWEAGEGEFADAWNARPLVIRLFELWSARDGATPDSA
jgi:hypothetical protein